MFYNLNIKKLIIKNRLKNIIVSIIICSGLLFSCGGSKKTSQFDESLYDDKISENLILMKQKFLKRLTEMLF